MRKFLAALSMLAAFASNALEPQRGYRGFVEWDNSIGGLNYMDNTTGFDVQDTQWFIGVATSHGYQFNRNWYVGGGTMISAATPSGEMMLPLFADVRYDGNIGRLTTFGDMRLGYNCCDGGGIYFSPTVGYRLNIRGKCNLNFGIGMTLRGNTVEQYRVDFIDWETAIVTYAGKKHLTNALLTLRLGIDF